jgi:hypothetical protein
MSLAEVAQPSGCDILTEAPIQKFGLQSRQVVSMTEESGNVCG